MLIPLKPEITSLADPSHDARRFRTVLRTFERNLELLFHDTGMTAHVDHAALATAFSAWRQTFDQTKHLATRNRDDYVVYAAGLMLRELIKAAPLSVQAPAAGSGADLQPMTDNRLKRWPEGYAYTSFCLAFVATIIGEQGRELPLPAKAAELMPFWDSFKENTKENPAMAVAFFDFICGHQPNWDAPDAPYLRPALHEPLKLG